MPLFTVLIRPLRQDMPGCCANRTNATLSCTPVHPWWTAGELKQEGYMTRPFCRNENFSQKSKEDFRPQILWNRFQHTVDSWCCQISTGHRALVVILPGNKSFQANTRGNASCFADTSFLKGHCLLMRWVNKGFSGGHSTSLKPFLEAIWQSSHCDPATSPIRAQRRRWRWRQGARGQGDTSPAWQDLLVIGWGERNIATLPIFSHNQHQVIDSSKGAPCTMPLKP